MEWSAPDRRVHFRTPRRCPLAQPTGRRIDGYCQESCEEVRREEAGREEVRRKEGPGPQEARSEEGPRREEGPCKESREENRSEAQAECRVHEGHAAVVAARAGRRRHPDA